VVNMPLLKVDEVTAGYGDSEILHGVSIQVKAGEIVSIIGPNGAGKSTLMKTIFGLLHPRQGAIFFEDREISQQSPYQIVGLGMCYVPQVANVFTDLTVEENLEMGAFILKGDLDRRKERIYELFPRLRERRRQRVGKMSGGERQMVAMGSSLMLDPQLVLMDEPSAGLSPKMVEVIFERIRHINKDGGPAILIVEQNARLSLQMADRGYVLAGGRNRFDGTGQALLDDPEMGRLYLGG
jgi:ABC-type branched-subunit amino acid transport system ATPase component